MSIRINWVNPNTIFTEIRLYRTEVPIDYTNIPASPLITLTNETTYLDTTAKQETYYYYTVAVVKDSEIVLTPSQLAYQLVDGGPGPKELQSGNWQYGYFGQVSGAELFTMLEIATLCNVGGSTSTEAAWNKYIFQGKILYFPINAVRAAVPWNTLYARGLVFGINGPGPNDLDLAATNQLKIVSKGNDDFIVRLPRGQQYGSPFTPLTAAFVANTELQLVGPATHGTSIGGWSGAALAQLPTPASAYDSWGMEYTGNNAVTLRTGTTLSSATRSNTTYAWRPILELVK